MTLAASILPALYGEPHYPGNVAILRFRLVESSQIVIPVVINHAGPYDFLVDTGTHVITVDLATDLHLKTEGTTGFVGVGFHIRPSFASLDTLEAGSHAVANLSRRRSRPWESPRRRSAYSRSFWW